MTRSKMFKAQFHVHTGCDPVDRPRHSEKQMLDFAAKHGYDVVSITCHNTVIFNEELRKYAEERNILLIPGIEKDVECRHVLIINATHDAEKIETFNDLETYKRSHPDCLIIAAHPYYFTHFCLKEKLEKHRALFDAIEYSWYHTKNLNKWNKKAEQCAEKYNLPIIATSDNHILKYFDYQYSFIEAEEKNWEAIRKTILQKGITVQKNPLSLKTFGLISYRMIVEFNLKNWWHKKSLSKNVCKQE